MRKRPRSHILTDGTVTHYHPRDYHKRPETINIDLSNQGITDDNLLEKVSEKVRELQQINREIGTLDLSGNNISVKGLASLMRASSMPYSIGTLDVKNTPIEGQPSELEELVLSKRKPNFKSIQPATDNIKLHLKMIAKKVIVARQLLQGTLIPSTEQRNRRNAVFPGQNDYQFIRENSELIVDIGLRKLGLTLSEIVSKFEFFRIHATHDNEEIPPKERIISLVNEANELAEMGKTSLPVSDSGSQIQWLRDKGRFRANHPPTPRSLS